MVVVVDGVVGKGDEGRWWWQKVWWAEDLPRLFVYLQVKWMTGVRCFCTTVITVCVLAALTVLRSRDSVEDDKKESRNSAGDLVV